MYCSAVICVNCVFHELNTSANLYRTEVQTFQLRHFYIYFQDMGHGSVRIVKLVFNITAFNFERFKSVVCIIKRS